MIITERSTESLARRELGGKGYHLFELQRAGLPVPPWVGLSHQLFSRYLDETGLRTEIGALLEAFLQEHAGARETSRRIAARIDATPLPGSIAEDCRTAFGLLDRTPISVRSSAADEDSAQHSFAGQLSTFLFVHGVDEALAAVRSCWASAFSERGLVYRKQNGLLNLERILVAVLFQEMVDADKAGVVFGADPVSGSSDVAVVNAVHGAGEGLVSGLLDADTFTLRKSDGGLVNSHVVTKCAALRKGERGKLEEVALEPELRNQPVLHGEELERVFAASQRIEAAFRWPQDIEWVMRQGELFILQSRPITTLPRNARGRLQIWDNGNIVESYGGLTLPLTFSFAFHAYSCVYVQLCEVLMVPARVLRALEPSLRCMIGIHKGRVYYNLLNWYRLLQVIPSSKSNQEFFEAIMAVGEEMTPELERELAPLPEMRDWRAKAGQWLAAFRLLSLHARAPALVDRFLKYFNGVYQEYSRIDFRRIRVEEAERIYGELEEKLLKRWRVPIINDALAMIHFGLLKKLAREWLGDAQGIIVNDLMRGEKSMESAEPTRALIAMAHEASANPQLRDLLTLSSLAEVEARLRLSPWMDFVARVDHYIEKFGHRSMNELKLEQKDLRQDASFLFAMLKNYLRNLPPPLAETDAREARIRQEAESRALDMLSWWKRPLFRWALRHARQAIRNRENLRFTRTRIFGLVRHLFLGVGEELGRLGAVSAADDVFYLTVPEVWSTCRASLPNADLKALVALRKREYAQWATEELPPRFLTRGPVHWMNAHPQAARSDGAPDGDHVLKGQGACPGVVEGVVKVILSPEDNLELNGEILVTLRTDPGWIPLYPSASGLLVERGGLLSHSAIVAREMGIPTVVSVPGLLATLKSGMRIRMDGERGTIEILAGEP